MRFLGMIAALATITTGVTAGDTDNAREHHYKIIYTRYHDLNCTQPFDDKPDHLHGSHCKKYHDEPHFSYSYKWNGKASGPPTAGNCQVAAWSGTRCERSAYWYSVGSATPSFDAQGQGPCVSAPEGAKSAWVKCWHGKGDFAHID